MSPIKNVISLENLLLLITIKPKDESKYIIIKIRKYFEISKQKKNHDKNRDSNKIVLRAGLKPATHLYRNRTEPYFLI